MVVLLKLRNGTEVIGEASQNKYEGVSLQDPFAINYRLVAGQPMPTISLSRYIPFSAEHKHFFAREDIMHKTLPSKAFEAYYLNSLSYCIDTLDKNIDEELGQAAEKTKNPKNDLLDMYAAILDSTQLDGPLN